MQQVLFPPATFPILETVNLRLRELVPSDAEHVLRIFADDEVTRYYDFDTFTSLGQAADLIIKQATRYEKGEAIRWGITQKANDVVIGTVGLVIGRSSAIGGLGYDLAQPYWRRGIMTEALRIVISYSFQAVNLNRLQALVMPGNVASMNLLKKLGFVEEGILREYTFFKGRYQDLHCFSLLRREFKHEIAKMKNV